MPHPKHAVGEKFDLAKMHHARERTMQAVHAIADKIVVGMSETQARALAMDVLHEMGMDRIWHPALVRFGANTLKKFNEASEGNPVLQPNDIFFVDLGVVWDGHEGDAGATFVVGDDVAMCDCAVACKQIYDEVKAHWHQSGEGNEQTRCSGRALYDFAQQVATRRGYVLNVEIRGHRVSDFPHAIYKAGDLGDLDAVPQAGLWILEIQIAHPNGLYGAFYEDLLVE